MRLAFAATLTLAALSASAQDSEQEVRARAPNATDLQLCRAMMYGPQPYQRVAAEEQRRRGLDCGPYVQAILLERQAPPAPAPFVMPPAPLKLEPVVPVPVQRTTTCTSQLVLGQLQTVCR